MTLFFIAAGADVPLSGTKSNSSGLIGAHRDRVNFNIQIRKLDAIGVPKSALVTNTDGSTYVYVVENETAKLKPIKVLYQNAETCAVSGIDANEVVVINGIGNLSDGSAVRIPKGQ